MLVATVALGMALLHDSIVEETQFKGSGVIKLLFSDGNL